MDIAGWAAMGILLLYVGTSCVAIWYKLAVVATRLEAFAERLKDIESNHLPTLTASINKLPCLGHMEELVKLTIRLEAITAQMAKLERKLNGA